MNVSSTPAYEQDSATIPVVKSEQILDVEPVAKTTVSKVFWCTRPSLSVLDETGVRVDFNWILIDTIYITSSLIGYHLRGKIGI